MTAPSSRPAEIDPLREGAGRGHLPDDPLLSIDPDSFDDPAARDWHITRMRRIRRWRRPLVTWRDRFRAWTNMLLADHGFIRAVYSNTWRITPSMWRSAQPLPWNIRRFARAGGRTVVTLRAGLMFGSLPLEVEACERAGLAFRTIVLRSRDLPERDEILAMLDELGTLETPVLFHCKSGADRAGFMAALWLLHVEKATAARAQAQLSLRYGHIRQSKTGVLDAFFEAYARDGEAEGIAFADWVRDRYDREAIKAAFRAGGLGTLLGDRLLARE